MEITLPCNSGDGSHLVVDGEGCELTLDIFAPGRTAVEGVILSRADEWRLLDLLQRRLLAV